MSIKLYSAIRFRERSMDAVHRKMLEIGPVLRAYVLELCRTSILHRAVGIFDEKVLAGEHGRNVVADAMVAFSEAAMKANKSAERAFEDFSLTVTVAPFEGRMYGIFHGDSKQVINRFMTLSKAEDYHYQNQTDEPDDVSPRAWARRREVWEGIFESSPSWVPSEIGPVYQLVPQTPTWMYGDRAEFKVQFRPVGQERFQRIAFNRVMDRVMKGELAHAGGIQAPGKEVLTSKIGTLYFDAARWVKTPAGQKLVEEEMAALGTKLPGKVTFDMLWMQEKKEK